MILSLSDLWPPLWPRWPSQYKLISNAAKKNQANIFHFLSLEFCFRALYSVLNTFNCFMSLKAHLPRQNLLLVSYSSTWNHASCAPPTVGEVFRACPTGRAEGGGWGEAGISAVFPPLLYHYRAKVINTWIFLGDLIPFKYSPCLCPSDHWNKDHLDTILK